MFSNVPFSCVAYPFTVSTRLGMKLVPAFQLHINVRPGVIAADTQLHQAVVHPDEHDGDDNQYDEEDDASHEKLLKNLKNELEVNGTVAQ